jgi:hypothetical protein
MSEGMASTDELCIKDSILVFLHSFVLFWSKPATIVQKSGDHYEFTRQRNGIYPK